MKTTNWWDGLSDSDVRLLQGINEPLGLQEFRDQSRLRYIYGAGDLEMYTDGGWIRLIGVTNPFPSDLKDYLTYRLRPDWVRPEVKRELWEYCEVECVGDRKVYTFNRFSTAWRLHKAQDMVGFGGYECKLVDGDLHWLSFLPMGDEEKGPATPLRVRFWRGEK